MALYQVRWTTRFRRDLRLCERRGKDLEKFKVVTQLLADGKSLPPHNKNHRLSGNWKGHMECHIEPDWLLVYRIFQKERILEYVRTGTHTDLFD